MKVKNLSKTPAHSLMRTIFSPQIFPLVSKERLMKSEGFCEYMSQCDDHFDRNRDVGPLERLLAVFDRSRYLDVLAGYLRARHGVQVTRQDEKIKVTVPKANAASPEPNVALTFSQYVSSAPKTPSSSLRKSTTSKAPGKSSPSKNVWGDRYVDALDHPARLTGSFEHGKRR